MKFGAGWIFGVVAALLIGCGSSGDTAGSTGTSGTGGKPGGSGGKLQIAVIPKGATHEFWKAIHAGAQKAGDELGVDIIWKGPLKEDDREDQIKVVEDFTTRKVSGIVLAPLDDTALRTPVDTAQKAGIPVVIIDSGLKDIKTASFVATDNFKAGQMAGERMVELLGGKGNVIMLRYQEGSASTTDRENGFLDAVKKSPGIKIVSDNQYAGATTETAQTASESMLQRFAPGGTAQFDGIYTPNESSTFGMLRALQNAQLAGKVKFVGFDSSELLIKGIQDNQIHALVIQNPEKMGYLGVKTLVESIQGKKVEERIDTGAMVIDAKNLATPEVQQLITPHKI